MALPATDAFTGTNGTNLSTYSANWTDGSNPMEIQSNRACGEDAGTNMSWWDADAFASAHYSKGTIAGTLTAGTAPGPAVRCQAGAMSFYYAFCDNGTCFAGESIAGVPTDWDAGQAFSLNDEVELRIDTSVTTTVYLYIAAALAATFTSKNALSGGAAGVSCFSNNAAIGIDNWEGGDTAAGGDPEGSLLGGKLLRGGLLLHGVLTR